jgi:hypothetical protein
MIKKFETILFSWSKALTELKERDLLNVIAWNEDTQQMKRVGKDMRREETNTR